MQWVSQIAFLITLGVAGYFLAKRIGRIRSNIKLGRDYKPEKRSNERLMQMLLIAFGQKKMFKKPIPAILHFFIYAGFLIINIEVLEFVIDGLLGTHRVFAPFLGSAYGMMMNVFEFFAVAVLVACIVFLIRRNVLGIDRFKKIEMKGWPTLDANLILVIESVLMLAILSMNATDQLLQERGMAHYNETGTLFFSSFFMPLFAGMSDGALVMVERLAWWFHIMGILAFAVYVTYSKHLHIFLAFPNTYFTDLSPKGKMVNMEEVTTEVKSMLGIAQENTTQGEIARLGAKDVNDLTWKNLMDAYSCTECGRCTAQCPANITGKKLSPRKIMMDTRDRVEEVGSSIASKGKGLEDGKFLLGDYISAEEVNACTTCNACVEACPVNINPLSIILQLRRYAALEESSSPASWNAMFENVENNFSPWKFSAADRFNWAAELKEEEQNKTE